MLKSTRNYFRRLAEGHEEGAVSKCLYPLLDASSGIYGLAASFTRALYEKKVLPRKRLPFPVISVGNFTWGGTGKTPLVEYLAHKVLERRKIPLILTRGYGADEINQMKKHLPRAVFAVGKDRYKAFQKLGTRQRIDIAILDDGFQHWPLERDIEIVTVNALNPFGNKKVLPRGILREPLKVLTKASIFVITHSNLISAKELSDLRSQLKHYAPDAFIVESYLEPLFLYRGPKRARVYLDRLKNQAVTTFSGIGCPRSLQLLLTRRQIKPIRNFEYDDHHRFSVEELEEIKRVSESSQIEDIITTEKDYFRDPAKMSRVLNPLILATRLRIASGEEILRDRLFQLLGVVKV